MGAGVHVVGHVALLFVGSDGCNGFIASVPPVWLLLAPRAHHLSAFMKVGTSS